MNTPEQSAQITRIAEWLGSGTINVFGRQFAGKDTVCRKLADIFDGPVIGGGDIIRSLPAESHIRKLIDEGHLAPQDEFIQLITPYLGKPENAGKPLFLSAVGRWIGEEQAIIKATEAAGHPIKAVLHIDITDDESRRRWSNMHQLGDREIRDDDSEDGLTNRLKHFDEKTLPVLDVYREKGLLIDVYGMASHDEVFKNVLAALAERAGQA